MARVSFRGDNVLDHFVTDQAKKGKSVIKYLTTQYKSYRLQYIICWISLALELLSLALLNKYSFSYTSSNEQVWSVFYDSNYIALRFKVIKMIL